MKLSLHRAQPSLESTEDLRLTPVTAAAAPAKAKRWTEECCSESVGGEEGMEIR